MTRSLPLSGLAQRRATARCRGVLLLVLTLALGACDNDGSADTQRRVRSERRTRVMAHYQAGQDFHLAVVWDSRRQGFIEGATLAAEEFNAETAATDERLGQQAQREQRPPPAASPRLVLDVTDERPFIDTTAVAKTRDEGRYRNAVSEAGTRLARQVLSNPEVSAVVGHTDGSVTLAAMLSYQKNGVLLLGGSSTDARLEWISASDYSETFGLYFQLLPADEVLAQRIAEAFSARGWRNAYLAYDDHHTNENLAQLLTSAFSRLNIKVYGSVAIRPGQGDRQLHSRRFRESLSALGNSEVDAIVLLTSAKEGAMVIRNGRGLGILQPFVGTSEFRSPEFIREVGRAGDNTLITTLYRQDSFVAKQFAQRFAHRFSGQHPNESAAMGYDSVRLYAEAVTRAGTVDPAAVSHVMRYDLPVVYGLLGSYVLKDGHNSGSKYHLLRLSRNQTTGNPEYVAAD